ncbi:glycosyltransferase family 4 protein [Elusimicrobiota bacterium]
MKTTLQVFNLRLNKTCSFTDYIFILHNKLTKKGVRNIYVFPSIESDKLRKKIESSGGEVIVIDGKWDRFSLNKQLRILVNKWEPAIIDFHFVTSINLLPFLIWLKFFQKSITSVFHYHGEIGPVESLRTITKYLSRLRLLTAFCDKLVTVSEANKKYLRTLNIKKEIAVISNGIDPETLVREDITRCRKEYHIPDNEYILLSIGSLIPRKGYDVLLKAMVEVIKDVPDTKLLIVGSGTLKDHCRQLAGELNIDRHIIFTGFHEDFPYFILSAADVYVSATNSESFGIAFAEAMAYSIPVVATNVGGVPEVVENGETGILVPVKDENALAGGIIKLLKDENLRKTMGEKGLARVKKLFGLDELVNKLIGEIYKL